MKIIKLSSLDGAQRNPGTLDLRSITNPIQKTLWFLLLMFAGLFSAVSHAAVNPLAVDQAFSLSVSLTSSDHALVQWAIAPEYQLYRKSLQITFPSQSIASTIDYPQGELKYDDIRGRYEAFLNALMVPVTLNTTSDNVTMQVDYQGCSEHGFCYPPMVKFFNLNLTTLAVTEEAKALPVETHSLHELLTNQQSVADVLKAQHLIVILFIFLGLGLLLAMTPCVLPMIPILTGIIAGSGTANNARRAFFLSLSYVLGTSITYAFAGVAAALLGSSLQVWLQTPWMIGLASVLFLGLALSLFGLYELRLPQGIHQRMVLFSNKQKGGSLVGVFIMGMISALIVSPCVTAPLVGVLMYIAQSGSVWLGASALFIMSLGMGLPLLFIGTSAGRWLPKSGPWMQGVKIIFGILMLAMAIWLLSRILPATLISFLWGILLLGLALACLFSLPHLLNRRIINRLLATIAGFSGMFFMVDVIKMPLFHNLKLASIVSHQQPFAVVHSLKELDIALSKAKVENRPAMLDFYADWCASCIVMEKTVLNQPDVKQAMNHYTLIRADLSANSSEDQALMKQFNIIAPPTVLFFDDKGKEMTSHRVIGELKSSEFLARVNASYASFCRQKQQFNKGTTISC